MLENWKTQIKKGYLELCILELIARSKRIYGFDIMEKLRECGLDVKEGTLYPLLNRMLAEEVLKATWDTSEIKGHPRKYYALTARGSKTLQDMKTEYNDMMRIYQTIETIGDTP